MRIAYFLGTFKKEDGVTRVLLSLVNEAQKRGVESIIITGFAEDESISPVPVIQVPSFAFPLYKDYKLPLPGVRGFRNELDKFKPDIIHVHSPETIAWAALKYSKDKNIPIVATYHTNFCRYLDYYNFSLFEPLVWDILKRLYSRMDLVTSPSLTVSRELMDLGLRNICTIPWGVESSKFNKNFRSLSWRQKITEGKEKKIILYVGRLTWEKDLRVLAEIYRMLKSKRDDFEIVVAGDGPIRKELELLMPGAKFLGHIEGKELSEVYASSDFLLFPSSTEVFANVPLEAISSGIIPIIADFGGIKSLVENKNICLLCKPKDSNDFLLKTNSLLDDQNLQEEMKINGEKFIKDFTPEKVFDEMMQKYSELINLRIK